MSRPSPDQWRGCGRRAAGGWPANRGTVCPCHCRRTCDWLPRQGSDTRGGRPHPNLHPVWSPKSSGASGAGALVSCPSPSGSIFPFQTLPPGLRRRGSPAGPLSGSKKFCRDATRLLLENAFERATRSSGFTISNSPAAAKLNAPATRLPGKPSAACCRPSPNRYTPAASRMIVTIASSISCATALSCGVRIIFSAAC